MSTLTAEWLRRILHYNPETGVFVWRVKPRRTKVKAGAIAGYRNSQGYWKIKIEGRKYSAHRLAWLYTTGRFPAGQLDHIDGERGNNRLINLREATHAENARNRLVAGKSGLRGVRRVGEKYQVRIRGNHLGMFDTIEKAYAVYCAAATAHFGEFAGVPDYQRR